MHTLKWLFWALLLAPLTALGQVDITVIVDMSKDGRKVEHPTPEKPAYYLPVMRGYQALGSVQAGEVLPSPHDIVRALAPELAKQGYLVVDAAHPKADLVIDFAWGSLKPTTPDDEHNEAQRYALSLGHTTKDILMPETYGHNEFMEGTREERYFLMLTAYDYAAYSGAHKNIILWKAKMSLPSFGYDLPDVIGPLAKAGGPEFGRETQNHPKLVPSVPVGHVEVGTPVEKKDSP